jgi:uncharacterized protein (TIGR02118 family)
MIKVCELVRRRPGASVEEFQAYWRSTHGPIVSAIPGVRRYVQSHPLAGGYRRGGLPYDGVAEIWADDKDALRAMAATPEFAAAKADEPNFIDTSALVELVVDEHELKGGPVRAEGVKSIAFVRFRDGLSAEDGQRYWRQVHGPIALGIPTLRRYVQSHVRLGAYRDGARPAWDGLTMTWFDSVDDMRASARTDAYAAVVADGPALLAPGPVPTILTTEHVLVG